MEREMNQMIFDQESGSDSETPQHTTILHLAGSVESEFLFNLSLIYCESAFDALTSASDLKESWLAVVTPQRTWHILKSFENIKEADMKYNIEGTDSLSQEEALTRMRQLGVEVVIPHMFCTEGMTTYKQIIADAGFKLMGNSGPVCAVAHNKQHTKNMLSQHGIRVPGGVSLKSRAEAPASFAFPCVVKAADLDNSVGVSYCETQEQYEQALDHVFTLSSDVLVEEYIAGHEIRCGIIETQDGGLRALPLIRYKIKGPIRLAEDKLKTSGSEITEFATKESMVELPAILDDAIRLKVEDMCKAAHHALGCELYSLFDVRVDESDAAILEACLFCSFGPKSVLPTLAAAEGTECVDFFQNLLRIRLARA